MTPDQATQYLLELNRGGAKFGIERMQVFADALGCPERAYPSIHVAGTNGKGSTCSFLEHIYRQAGYKTGMFTSPHLTYIGERIRVQGQPIDPMCLGELVASHKVSAEAMTLSGGGEMPTYFEFMTGIAFSHFKEKAVDLAIVEVGLGGRLDSTNILNPSISVITSIGLDHCEQLGSTLESIAREKAGIIKEGVPLVIGELPDVAETVVRAIAKEKKVPVYSVRERFHGEAYPLVDARAPYQRKNAAVARLVVEVLSGAFPVDQEAVSQGLLKAFWPGRWQEISLPAGRTLILESAHNEEGARALDESLEHLFREGGRGRLTVLLGSLGVDRAAALLQVVARYAHEIVLLEPNQPRALSVADLRALVPGGFGGRVLDGRVNALFADGRDFLGGESGDLFLVVGSVYLVGEVLGAISGTHALNGQQLQDCLV